MRLLKAISSVSFLLTLTLAIAVTPISGSQLRSRTHLKFPALMGNREVTPLSLAPSLEWNHTYGGDLSDSLTCVIQTSDGGYAMTGTTNSYGAGSWDFWLVKVDTSGNLQWNRTYGGIHSDIASAVVQTGDGGYMILGSTASFGAGASDVWLVKTNSAGNMIWNRTYGGGSNDVGRALVATHDLGYAIAGYTESYSAGYQDFWLLKTNTTGDLEWNRVYGRADQPEEAWALTQTNDFGYALAGNQGSNGDRDFWVVKTDVTGTMQWNSSFGGGGWNDAYAILQTPDSGYAVGGSTTRYGAGSWDYLLIKLNSGGELQWNQTYGKASADAAYSMISTSDGGYAIGGGSTNLTSGEKDFWLVKTDAVGNLQWNKTAGVSGFHDTAWSLRQTNDDGYALAGDILVTSNNDALLVKLTPSEEVHDLAVTDMVSSKTSVGQGSLVGINLTVENLGGFSEVFNVTVYANNTEIETLLNLPIITGQEVDATFTWNTSGWVKGNYSLSGHVWPVPGENITSNNELALPSVLISIPGDIDGNRVVDIFDIVRIAGVYGVTQPSPQYDPHCDLDDDGDIDIFDVVRAASNYGESW